MQILKYVDFIYHFLLTYLSWYFVWMFVSCWSLILAKWMWIKQTDTPSVIHVSVGRCTVWRAIYLCYIYVRLISWRAAFRYCQMCWLLVSFLSLLQFFVYCIKNVVYVHCAEKFANQLTKVGKLCESEARGGDWSKAQLQLLKFAKQRAYPAKGRHRKSATVYTIVAWVYRFFIVT